MTQQQEVNDLSALQDWEKTRIYSVVAHKYPFVLVLNEAVEDYFDKNFPREKGFDGIPVHLSTGLGYRGSQGPKVFAFKTEEGMRAFEGELKAFVASKGNTGLETQSATIGKQIIPVYFDEAEKTALRQTVVGLFNAAGQPINDAVAATVISLAIDTLASADRKPDGADPEVSEDMPYFADRRMDSYRQQVTAQRVVAAIKLQLRQPSF